LVFRETSGLHVTGDSLFVEDGPRTTVPALPGPVPFAPGCSLACLVLTAAAERITSGLRLPWTSAPFFSRVCTTLLAWRLVF